MSDPQIYQDTLSPELLAILICPVSGGPLEFDEETMTLYSPKANLVYPIIDGIIRLEKNAATAKDTAALS